MKRASIVLFVIVMALGFSLQAYAELFLRGTDSLGNRLIYDTDLNITWYDYTKSNNTWQNQMNWASGLTVNFGGTIFDDWKLPTALNQDGTGPCYGYNCTGSEMGHLYYTELGNSVGALSTTGNFQNLIPDAYWLGTEYAANTNFAVFFSFHGTLAGLQIYDNKYSDGQYAIAVRTGDVTLVPEPISSILFITGGAVLAGRRYLKKRRNT